MFIVGVSVWGVSVLYNTEFRGHSSVSYGSYVSLGVGGLFILYFTLPSPDSIFEIIYSEVS